MRWIPATDRLPTHPYSVFGWVTEGGLVIPNERGMRDIVTYFPKSGRWHQPVDGGDAHVEVSHWMDLPPPPGGWEPGASSDDEEAPPVAAALALLDEAARLRDVGDIGARDLERRARELLRAIHGVKAGDKSQQRECKACHGKGYTNEGDPEIGNALFACEACSGTGCIPAAAVRPLPAMAVAPTVSPAQVSDRVDPTACPECVGSGFDFGSGRACVTCGGTGDAPGVPASQAPGWSEEALRDGQRLGDELLIESVAVIERALDGRLNEDVALALGVVKRSLGVSLLGLGQRDRIVSRESDVDQRVAVPAAGAGEEAAHLIDLRLNRQEHDEEVAAPAGPHAANPTVGDAEGVTAGGDLGTAASEVIVTPHGPVAGHHPAFVTGGSVPPAEHGNVTGSDGVQGTDGGRQP